MNVIQSFTSRSLLVVSLMSSVGCSVFGINLDTQEPAYRVVEHQDDMEIRVYAPLLQAKVTVAGDFKEAQSEGFRMLADYIFGNNIAEGQIAMTAPVTQKKTTQKIAMTSPVSQEKSEAGYVIAFTMPAEYTMENIPKPKNAEVLLEALPTRYVAVITFSGFWKEKKIMAKESMLREWLEQFSMYSIESARIFAGYNPPWTLPFLRKNEVMLELALVEKK